MDRLRVVGRRTGDDGSVERKWRVAGGDDELIFQPEWSPDGALYFVSDRAQRGLDGRWWNLFTRARRRDRAGCILLAAEFGRPQIRTSGCRPLPSIRRNPVCSYVETALSLEHGRFGIFGGQDWSPHPFKTSPRCVLLADAFISAAARQRTRPSIVEFDLGSGRQQNTEAVDHRGYRSLPRLILSAPEPVTFDTDHGRQAHGLYYKPRNVDFAASA